MNACQPGHEDYRICWSENLKHNVVQYDYRTEAGDLFSCVATDLHAARAKRDYWLLKRENKPTVYLLTAYRGYSRDTLTGVFSTSGLAMQVYKKLNADGRYDSYDLTPFVVDEEAK